MARRRSTPAGDDAPRICSFPPIARRDARVLVLGSMPSIRSLAAGQYYGHPQNAFWKIMGELFGAGPELPYRQRAATLRRHRVAVWDVLAECHRPGSLDTSIARETERPNDLAGFFAGHPQLRHVFFNGGWAEAAFRRHVRPTLGEPANELSYTRLPSTSPAHAGRSFAEKLASWRVVAEAASSL